MLKEVGGGGRISLSPLLCEKDLARADALFSVFNTDIILLKGPGQKKALFIGFVTDLVLLKGPGQKKDIVYWFCYRLNIVERDQARTRLMY